MAIKPEIFGEYILLDKIAMGGMAEVYRAKSFGAEGIGKIIAIKRILPQFSANHEFIEMFKSEAKIAINLTQGNIGQIYKFGEEQKLFYLAMEYIEGRNLRQILTRCTKAQKALTIEQCVYIIGQVANGLDHAHRTTNKNTGNFLNLIHRDMSPQNIMVSFEGEVKIIDFGIAKAESKIETTRAGILKGKFGYMSPEQAEGLDLDSRTDIFSTGIVLWELLSGERLFVAHNEVNTIRKIRECQIPSLRKVNPNVHEELERITSKALAKDRSLRYQTASELYRDLSRFLYKVNPEFTPHELCVFTKSLFKEDILEDRKQVMEFAKITFPAKHREEKTQGNTGLSSTFTEPIDVTALSTNSTRGELNDDHDDKDHLNENNNAEEPHGGLDVPKNLKMDNVEPEKELAFDIKVDRVYLLRQVQSRSSNNTNIKTATSFTTRPGLTGPLVQTMYSGTNNSYNVPPRHRHRHLPKIIVGVSALLIISIGYKNQEQLSKLSERFRGNVSSQTDMQSKTPAAGGAVEVPQISEKSRVFIRSIPAGADILIDGEIKGTTPAEIILPVQKRFTIALNRDGYFPYRKDFLATRELEDFSATLQKASTGYLSIEVTPSTAEIYVNGQRLIDKSPIKRFPVPAGVPIRIRAVNHFSNSLDEAVVTVKQDSVKTIKLFPRKPK